MKGTSARPLTADVIVKENARKRQAPSALGNNSLFEAAAKRRPGPSKHGPMVSAVLLPIESQCLAGSVCPGYASLLRARENLQHLQGFAAHDLSPAFCCTGHSEQDTDSVMQVGFLPPVLNDVVTERLGGDGMQSCSLQTCVIVCV